MFIVDASLPISSKRIQHYHSDRKKQNHDLTSRPDWNDDSDWGNHLQLAELFGGWMMIFRIPHEYVYIYRYRWIAMISISISTNVGNTITNRPFGNGWNPTYGGIWMVKMDRHHHGLPRLWTSCTVLETLVEKVGFGWKPGRNATKMSEE